jgi:hypothetical protein
MSSNGSTLAAQVSFRIGGKLTTAQIIPFLNSGLSLVEAAGSYSWDAVNTTGTANGSGQWPVPVTADIGREFAFTNVNGLMIAKAMSGEALWMSANYKNVGLNVFNQWYFLASGTLPATIQFVPAAALSFNVIYHNLAVVLLAAAGPVTPWLETWLDDLVVDYAESEIKRVLDWTGWQELQGRFIAKLQEVTKIFSSQRENTGPAAEVQGALAEKMTGRT